MKTILLHGLGQTSSSWKNTINTMGKSADILCPNLFDWFEDKEVCYQVLYLAFSEYCKQFSEPVNICGLSLGGILALQYGIENPDKINSLALVATQYTMPKKLLQFQNMRYLPPTVCLADLPTHHAQHIRQSPRRQLGRFYRYGYRAPGNIFINQ